MSSTDAAARRPPDVDRRAASRAAVAARRARAEIKRSIATKKRSALTVLESATSQPNTAEATLRVTEFLTAMPGVGPVKMRRALASLRISEAKRLGGLGVHQRERLRQFVQARTAHSHPSRLTVLAGPTAVGKGTVAAYIKKHHPDIRISVSATTRPPRRGEVHGVDYYFTSDEEFDSLIENHELLEWAVVHNRYRYGTPRAAIEHALMHGQDVLLEIDLQGARMVRAAMPDARLIFLKPPSWEELVRRLTTRGTEDVAEQQRRLETAKVELAAQDEFDEVVVNHDVSAAAEEVVNLMEA